MRGRLLAARGCFEVIPEGQLTVTALAAAAARAVKMTPAAPKIDMDGAANTAKFIASLL